MIADILLVIDLQKGVASAGNSLADLEQVIQGVNERIAYYRKNDKPILFIQHEGEGLVKDSLHWELLPEIDARSTDIYMGKTHANSFYQTELIDILKSYHVQKIELCGAQTEYCVDTTIRYAHGLGYSLFMKKGLHTTTDNGELTAEQIRQHHATIWDQRFLTFID